MPARQTSPDQPLPSTELVEERGVIGCETSGINLQASKPHTLLDQPVWDSQPIVLISSTAELTVNIRLEQMPLILIKQAERAGPKGQRREDGSPTGQDASGGLVHDSRPAGQAQKAARPSGLPRLRSCSRFRHQWVFRPKMLRISTFKILLHFRIGATPKIG